MDYYNGVDHYIIVNTSDSNAREFRFVHKEDIFKCLFIESETSFLIKMNYTLIKCKISYDHKFIFVEYYEKENVDWYMKNCYRTELTDGIEKLLFDFKEYHQSK